jgi:hypothetical protein
LRVEEAQRRGVDADADPAAAEDIGGQDLPLPERDAAAAVHRPVHLDHVPGLRGRDRRWSGGAAAVAQQAVEIGHRQVRAWFALTQGN